MKIRVSKIVLIFVFSNLSLFFKDYFSDRFFRFSTSRSFFIRHLKLNKKQSKFNFHDQEF